MSILSAITGGLGGIIGGVAGIGSSIITAKANQREAERNRNWQEELSNTAHQREVEDLKKAGLNPALSAGAGASTGSGAQATMDYNNGVNETIAGLTAKEELKIKKATLEQLKAETNRTKAETENQNLKTKADIKQINTATEQMRQNININKPTEEINKIETGIINTTKKIGTEAISTAKKILNKIF